MMDYLPQLKRDEQYPLLKVETGGGGTVQKPQTPSVVASSGWHVACIPKQSWCNRWPEFISAFWMTTILLAISFFVFYALSINAYRRQAVVIIRCNDTKPASDVFYHHVSPQDANVPFALFSEYLSYMAKQYPMLRFNVHFLIDDSWQNRHFRLLKRLIPQITSPFNTILDQNYKREIKDFQRRYQNVNISVMCLSKYMAGTPLRFKWRTIPQKYLSFYARIFAIWQNGGIGLDLETFNNQFHNNRVIDHRIDAILKQHHDGIKLEKYTDTLNSFDDEEQNQLFSFFFNLINQIITDTSYLFGAELNPNIKVVNNNPVFRSRSNKRDIKNNTVNATEISEKINIKNETIHESLNKTTEKSNFDKRNISKEINKTNQWNLELLKQHDVSDLIKMPNVSELNTVMPQFLFFYDILGFSDDIGPPYSLHKTFATSDTSRFNKRAALKSTAKYGQSKSEFLSLTPEGHFVAASSRHHPFLGQLVSARYYTVSPKYAIKNTLLSQCSGLLRDDIYCDNIRIIYNIV